MPCVKLLLHWPSESTTMYCLLIPLRCPFFQATAALLMHCMVNSDHCEPFVKTFKQSHSMSHFSGTLGLVLFSFSSSGWCAPCTHGRVEQQRGRWQHTDLAKSMVVLVNEPCGWRSRVKHGHLQQYEIASRDTVDQFGFTR